MLTNFGYILEDQLAGSAHPGHGNELRKNLQWLYEKGFRSILSLTTDQLNEALISEQGMQLRQIALPDMHAPSLEQIEEAVEFLNQAINERKEKALVHCGAGYGRTGTILACYLVSRGMSASEAIDLVRNKRPGSIETDEQEEIVREFAESRGVEEE